MCSNGFIPQWSHSFSILFFKEMLYFKESELIFKPPTFFSNNNFQNVLFLIFLLKWEQQLNVFLSQWGCCCGQMLHSFIENDLFFSESFLEVNTVIDLLISLNFNGTAQENECARLYQLQRSKYVSHDI